MLSLIHILIRRWESGDMLRALALDCSAAAAVEQMCDQIELELQGHFPGCSFPFRYSPGSVSYTHLDVYKRQVLDMAAPPFLCDISVASPGGKYKGRGKSIKFNAPIRCGMGVPFLTLRRESCLKNMPWAGGGSVLPLSLIHI